MALHLPHRPSGRHTELVRRLVAFTGRDPAGYLGLLGHHDGVCVVAPHIAVFYPAQGWTSTFMRHLHAGDFDYESGSAAVPLPLRVGAQRRMHDPASPLQR